MYRAARTILCLLAASWGTAAADPKAEPSQGKPGAKPEAKTEAKTEGKPEAKTESKPDANVRTIIIVRHAEAAGNTHNGGDPVLSSDGKARAVELARTLADTPLRAVYTTHYQRNRQTAEPLPRHIGEKPTVIDDVPSILAALRAEPWGATALVIGHSNTVPELVRGLTGQALPGDEPIVYDRIWIVLMMRDGGVSLLRLRYGAPVAVAK
jgi:phosphohistidine phosphatase SixA